MPVVAADLAVWLQERDKNKDLKQKERDRMQLSLFTSLCATQEKGTKAEAKGLHAAVAVDLALCTIGEGREPDAEAEAGVLHAFLIVDLAL